MQHANPLDTRGGPAMTFERRVMLFLVMVGVLMWLPLIYVLGK